MVDKKYIGLAMAMVGSFIGTSIVIVKMGLTASDDGMTYTDNKTFLRNSMCRKFRVTPLGALSVVIAAVFASFLHDKRPGHLGRVGCTQSILESSIIVFHAPEDQELETVAQFLEYAIQPVLHRLNPLVYISIASLVGSVSVMFLTFSGDNQLVCLSTYLFVVIAGVCVVVQLNYANKVLDLFSVNLVSPIHYVGFCTATIVASLTLFKGFNTSSASNTLSFLSGFIVTFLDMHIFNLAMLDESEAASSAASNVSLGEPVDAWARDEE
ncbi:magnesium transporter NIPA-domain-containing protein [Mycena capillaripes]|nr:magnesium transporter NIPA-domain-containing protein [Mycena capillaripes]